MDGGVRCSPEEGQMRQRKISDTPRTFAVIFVTGDEIAKGLKEFANKQELAAASFKAIGALSSVELGWFDWDDKQYHTSVKLDEQIELLSLIGDIAVKDGKSRFMPTWWSAKRMAQHMAAISSKLSCAQLAKSF
jgi:hypothetical protein